jgi:hypothetical protein
MKTLFNTTTCYEDTDRYADEADFRAFAQEFDGAEVMEVGPDERGIIPVDLTVGVHLGYYVTWYDFWRKNTAGLVEEYGSLEEAYKQMRGSDPQVIVDRFKRDMEFAHKMNAEYVVFHVSESGIYENYTFSYKHTDEEIVDAAAEILNEVFAEEDGSIALLMENQWQAGLTFLRPEIAQRLLDRVEYPNKGFMLDTGHLMHTNFDLATQEEALAYVNGIIDRNEAILPYVRGMHFHQSLTGEYCKRTQANPPALAESYSDRYWQSFGHAFAVDGHQPWCTPGIGALVARVDPEYLVWEFISGTREEHQRLIDMQRAAFANEA